MQRQSLAHDLLMKLSPDGNQSNKNALRHTGPYLPLCALLQASGFLGIGAGYLVFVDVLLCCALAW